MLSVVDGRQRNGRQNCPCKPTLTDRYRSQAIKCRLCELPPEGAEWTVAALDRLVELMPSDELRVVEVITEEGQELAQVEVYEIAKDGEMLPVSVSATGEQELW